MADFSHRGHRGRRLRRGSRMVSAAAVFAAASASFAVVSARVAISSSAPNCTLPALSVGSLLNSSKDLTRLLKKQKHVLVGFSAASSCAKCCLWEPNYRSMLDVLPAHVQWARVDLDRLEARALAAAYDIETLPSVVFFRERKPTMLLEVQRPQTIVAMVARSLTPLMVVHSGSEELTAFLDLSQRQPLPLKQDQGTTDLLGDKAFSQETTNISLGSVGQPEKADTDGEDIEVRKGDGAPTDVAPAAVAPMGGAATAIVVRVVALFDGAVDDEDIDEITEGARSYAGRPFAFQFARTVDAKAREELVYGPADAELIRTACGGLARKGRALVVLALADGEYVDKSRFVEGHSGNIDGQELAEPVVDIRQRRLAVPLATDVAVRRAAFAGEGFVYNASLAAERLDEGANSFVSVAPRIACRAIDAYDGLSFEQWVLRASLPPVGRFDMVTSSLYERTQKPILMMFVDTRHAQLANLLRLLQTAHVRYNGREGGLLISFVYIDGVQFSHRMSSLGLAADTARLPALCFNYVTEKVLTWQPHAAAYANGSATLTADVLDSLVQQYLHGDGGRPTEAAAPKALAVPKRSISNGDRRNVPDLNSLSLEERLRFVPAVNQESFAEVVLDSSRDVAVYFFASSGPAAEASKTGAIFLNRCAERFEELSIRTAKVVRLDMARFSAPTQIQISEIPSVVMFPAFSKDPPHQVFRGKFKVQHIMWWIQDRASLKFSLPELPHLDEIEAKAYWEQKAELPMERQERIARENERAYREKSVMSAIAGIGPSGSAAKPRARRRARRRRHHHGVGNEL
eukprot:TRINITY_DN13832_c2_g1_i1.p1 TRINITY_DN13832_c2_g1~~TRINITY_DN13832_c2_g1_i1.p1  ORF type:complete len:836 (-),score=145.35 TRINITY_DN13832_c2_g1_i1:85-2493(-)